MAYPVRPRGVGALACFFEQGSGIRNISLPVWAQWIGAGGKGMAGTTSERETREEATITVCPCNGSKF